MNQDTIANFGGRRFILSTLTFVVSSLLLAFEKLTDSGFVTITLATVAVYVAGNVSQKVVEMRTTGLPAGTPVAQPVAADDTAMVAAQKEQQ